MEPAREFVNEVIKRCEGCGGLVLAVSSKEGTNYYVPYGELLLEETVTCMDCGKLVSCQTCGRPIDNLAKFAKGGFLMEPVVIEPGVVCVPCSNKRPEVLRKVTVIEGAYASHDGASPKWVLHRHGPTYRCSEGTYIRMKDRPPAGGLDPEADPEAQRLECRFLWSDLVPAVGRRRAKWTITIEAELEDEA